MKKAIAVIAALAWTITPANADVYVKVDANGNAIGEAIMCDAVTCGANSDYSRATLQAGERYVLQGSGYAGIGNNNPNTAVTVNVEKKEWTVSTPTTVATFNSDYGYTHINPIVSDTATIISDTATATIDTATATSASTTFESLYAQIMALLTQILALIAKLNG